MMSGSGIPPGCGRVAWGRFPVVVPVVFVAALLDHRLMAGIPAGWSVLRGTRRERKIPASVRDQAFDADRFVAPHRAGADGELGDPLQRQLERCRYLLLGRDQVADLEVEQIAGADF